MDIASGDLRYRGREMAGVPHFRFHDTRDERTSNLFEAEWSMVQVMAQKWTPPTVRYAGGSAPFFE